MAATTMRPAVIQTPLPTIRHADALAIGKLLDRIWPKDGSGPEERAKKLLRIGAEYEGAEARQPRSLIVQDASEVIAHAMVFERVIHLGDEPRSVMALAAVCSNPDRRGEGLGDAVVRAAFDLVDDGTFPMSLFQTSFPVEAFYNRFGACRVQNRIVNTLAADDPTANPFWDDIVMRYPASGHWSDADVDLRGPGY